MDAALEIGLLLAPQILPGLPLYAWAVPQGREWADLALRDPHPAFARPIADRLAAGVRVDGQHDH